MLATATAGRIVAWRERSGENMVDTVARVRSVRGARACECRPGEEGAVRMGLRTPSRAHRGSGCHGVRLRSSRSLRASQGAQSGDQSLRTLSTDARYSGQVGSRHSPRYRRTSKVVIDC